MSYTVEQFALAMARRDVMAAISERNILLMDPNDLELAAAELLKTKDYTEEAQFYVKEWSRLDALEAG